MDSFDWKAERQKHTATTIPKNAKNRWYKKHPLDPYTTAYASPGVTTNFDGALAPSIPPTVTGYSQPYVSPFMNDAAKKAKQRQGMR